MMTISGNLVDYENGFVNVDIFDIAHSLSIQNRFIGNTIVPYSVAQHCYFVSEVVEEKFALWGLLHDSAEAYIGDIITPIKTKKQRAIEIELLKCVAAKFGMSLPIPSEVKEADRRMLVTEMCSQLVFYKPEFAKFHFRDIEPYDIEIKPWNWVKAKKMFLKRFYELK